MGLQDVSRGCAYYTISQYTDPSGKLIPLDLEVVHQLHHCSYLGARSGTQDPEFLRICRLAFQFA